MLDINIDVNGDFDDVWDFMKHHLFNDHKSSYVCLEDILKEMYGCDVEVKKKDAYTLDITLKKKYILIEL